MRPETFRRYGSGSLPRYTSYPTAPHFTAEVGEQDYRSWLGELGGQPEISLYLHIPFCRSMCWYCGCHTTVTARKEPITRYLTALEREAEIVAAATPVRLSVSHLHLGGGTPTLMDPTQMIRLIYSLRRRFAFASRAELAIEVDPRTLTSEMAVALGQAGFTRASLGVQSFDIQVQKALNRVQSFDETARAVSSLRQQGIAGINLDLIYGLPHQTEASCIDTVEQALVLQPERFAVFGYAHVPSLKRHQRKIDASVLPGTNERLAQSQVIADALVAVGYIPIGLDHFARPDDPLAVAAQTGRVHRNFQGYTTDGAETLIGLGASAIGRLPNGYVQNSILISEYEARIAKGKLPVSRGYPLSREDRLRARIIEEIMCSYQVDLAGVCLDFDVEPETVMDEAKLDRLLLDGIISRKGYYLSIKPDARPLVRAVAAAFDAYLPGTETRHARAI
jgi:oxygen-independent coproporphyrinogen III oxidase